MLEKQLKKLDVWDISLTKLSVMAFVLFVLVVLPDLASWLLAQNPIYYLALFITFAARPLYKVLAK